MRRLIMDHLLPSVARGMGKPQCTARCGHVLRLRHLRHGPRRRRRAGAPRQSEDQPPRPVRRGVRGDRDRALPSRRVQGEVQRQEVRPPLHSQPTETPLPAPEGPDGRVCSRGILPVHTGTFARGSRHRSSAARARPSPTSSGAPSTASPPTCSTQKCDRRHVDEWSAQTCHVAAGRGSGHTAQRPAFISNHNHHY